jgi:integrase
VTETGALGDGLEGLRILNSGKLQARYRDRSGKFHTKTWDSDTKKNRRLAQEWRALKMKEVREGTHIVPTKVTVLDWANQWVDNRTYRPSSQRQAVTYLNHLSNTRLGHQPIASVLPHDIEAWIKDRSRVLAPTTLGNVYTFVKAVFRSAVENRLLPTTPCISTIKLPKAAKPKVEPLTIDEVVALSDAMTARYRAAVIIQAAAGLRVSELLGLQVRDIDFLRRTLRVERQLLRDGGSFGPPKTPESERVIPLPANVLPILSEHIRQYPPNDDGVLFTTTHGNPIRQDVYSDAIFKPAVRRAGLADTTTSHDLRHTFASVLLRRGVPVNIVARFMGHSTAALVLSTYGHLMPGSDDVIREALDAVWADEGVTDVSPAAADGQ